MDPLLCCFQCDDSKSDIFEEEMMPMENFYENIHAIFHQRTRTHLVQTNQGTHLVQTKSKDKESSPNTGRVIKASMLFAGKVKLHKVPQSVLLCPFRLNTTKTKLA